MHWSHDRAVLHHSQLEGNIEALILYLDFTDQQFLGLDPGDRYAQGNPAANPKGVLAPRIAQLVGGGEVVFA
jgi:hypothetical protein